MFIKDNWLQKSNQNPPTLILLTYPHFIQISMYSFIWGRWLFPRGVAGVITIITQRIPSIILSNYLFWFFWYTSNDRVIFAKRAVKGLIQWIIQHTVTHNRCIKTPWAGIWLIVPPWTCVRLVILGIITFGIVFTRRRNLLFRTENAIKLKYVGQWPTKTPSIIL